MANVIRSAKSSGKWNDNDLIAYNITVTAVPSQQFFLQETDVSLTVTGLDPTLATAADYSDANISDSTYSFLRYLHDAITPRDGMAIRVSRVDEFTREVLVEVDFKQDVRGMLIAHSIPLLICDEIRKVAKINLCLRDFESKMILFLQMNKTPMGRSNVEARMIVGAIAAYQYNNNKRQKRDLHPLDTMTIPCITMVRARPTFYLVPVTKALNDAVISGQYPSDRTEVLKCEVASDYDGGMEAPEYRGVALQYYVAFKSLAKSHWEKFLG
ncbi:hypothetical protein F4604DRAFT_1300295 [Suillus subluteus]|nr:hypothetical protein F4604DRAFT_1300295 [Suillus subluteus]